MAFRVAINGFGRIGRMVLRSFIEHHVRDIDIVAINDLGDTQTNAHLLTYDSAHGQFQRHISCTDNEITIHNHHVKILKEKDPSKLPWKDLDIDLVLECSGHFNTKKQASLHLEAGAKRVLVSAPCDNADITVVYGVNHQNILPSMQIISNASCTTNCLTPLAYLLDKAFGIDVGYMTTIHSYTADQRLVDGLHNDLRRARAASHSMIPTSTGAAKSVGLVLPHLNGKLDGTAIRVPTLNVSAVDFTFTARESFDVAAINQTIEEGALSLEGILSVSHAPLVSCDFNHTPYSCIFDATQTQVVNRKMGRVLAWYDNEWGFANRLIDVASYLAKQRIA